MEVPFVALFDFFGDDSVTGDPVEKEAAQESNRDFWAQLHHLFSDEKRLGIFIGELEDIPDESLGPDLPNVAVMLKRSLSSSDTPCNLTP